MKNEWYLRTQDETFGPETKERLIEWAQMGRIQPGQDISDDGENWRPATEIPFLDMRWSIDIGDGQPRGPFNKHAAQALLASGRLPRGSTLVEVRPAFSEPAADAPNDANAPSEATRHEAAQSTRNVEATKESTTVKDPAATQEIQALQEQNDRLEAKIKQMREDAKAIRSELAEAQKLLAAKDSVLAERNSELAERASALEAKDSELAAKDSALAAKDTALAERNSALVAKDSELAAVRAESEKSLRALESPKD